MPRVQLFARDDGHNGGQAPGCRRDPHRQDQHGPVRHRIGGRALPLRGLFEHLRRALHFRRLQLGFGGSRCPGSGGVFARHRYSGVGARSRSLQQSDRPEADSRRAEHQWHRSRLPHARLCFDLCALLRRCPRGVVGSAGLRPGRPLFARARDRRGCRGLERKHVPLRRTSQGTTGVLRRRRGREAVRRSRRTIEGTGRPEGRDRLLHLSWRG